MTLTDAKNFSPLPIPKSSPTNPGFCNVIITMGEGDYPLLLELFQKFLEGQRAKGRISAADFFSQEKGVKSLIQEPLNPKLQEEVWAISSKYGYHPPFPRPLTQGIREDSLSPKGKDAFDYASKEMTSNPSSLRRSLKEMVLEEAKKNPIFHKPHNSSITEVD